MTASSRQISTDAEALHNLSLMLLDGNQFLQGLTLYKLFRLEGKTVKAAFGRMQYLMIKYWGEEWHHPDSLTARTLPLDWEVLIDTPVVPGNMEVVN